VTHDRINGRITAITGVQILGDYSDIPLPARRKKTVVDSEDQETDSLDGSNLPDTSNVLDDEDDSAEPTRKRRKVVTASRRAQIVPSNAAPGSTPLRRSQRQVEKLLATR
jgi:hypothetical protein